ncbi:transcription antitermination factor NusB [Marinilabiliaceae bacterium JC017]|nr:transcription antitermination factor NusB [Marinilabiliaceae bacterium JC017]
MLSRRLLRVKIMQMVYAYYKKGENTIQQTEKELFHSISKSHELYHFLLLLLTEIHAFAENRIEFGKQKRRPNHEDLNPNTRFIDNQFLRQLISNAKLNRYVDQTGLSWANHPEIVKNLYNEVVDSQLYQEYMNSDLCGYEDDKRFVVKLFEKVIAPYEPLYILIEEQSIYWNDEAEFVISMTIKTIKSFVQDKKEEQELLPEFKDQDDREFVKKLFRKAILNNDDYSKLIKQYTKNWDFDRVAFMDIVIMQIAIAELMEFPNIPVRVTLNEYIEIAKHYSTNKSGIFINGILDKIVSHLVREKKLLKPDKSYLQSE